MRFLWPGSVEVVDIGSQDPLELLLLEDEQVIETLATYTAQKPFTDGIGAWRVIRCFQDRDATGCCHASKTVIKLAITIAKEILRPLSIGGCLSQLLGCPSIGWRSCHADVDHFARVQEGGEEGIQRTEEEIRDRQEVARPDVFGMIVQEGGPGLSSLSW